MRNVVWPDRSEKSATTGRYSLRMDGIPTFSSLMIISYLPSNIGIQVSHCKSDNDEKLAG